MIFYGLFFSFLLPPSSKPYNMQFMKSNIDAIHYTHQYRNQDFWSFIDKELRVLFPRFTTSRQGFFVEAGAFDGEFMSNSLYLEFELGWKGLLVEPQKELFQALLKKNRKAWACQCCLSTQPYPHEVRCLDLKNMKVSNDFFFFLK